MNAVEHLERHLGKMERGFDSASLPGVQICLFRNQPQSGVVTLTTLGLSNNILAMNGDRVVRQELILAATADEHLEDLAKILFHISEKMILKGRALLRGHVLNLGERMSQSSAADAVYASIPVCYPEEIATLDDTDPSTVFVWLIPVHPSETAVIESSGWSEFEDRLEAANVDLFDLRRDSIIAKKSDEPCVPT